MAHAQKVASLKMVMKTFGETGEQGNKLIAGVVAGQWYHKMNRPSSTKVLLNPCLYKACLDSIIDRRERLVQRTLCEGSRCVFCWFQLTETGEV